MAQTTMMNPWRPNLGLLLAVLVLFGAHSAHAQFVPDDFNACEIDPIWTFVDNVGDGATAAISGAYTDDAAIALSVPGGAAHEIWGTSINAPHVIQTMTDTDFVAEVKFDSDLTTLNGQEGIFIQQDDSNWLRLEFYRHSGGQMRIAAIGGPTTVFHDEDLLGPDVPLYMRVERVDDDWTLSWSEDGTNWNVDVGPFNFTYAFAPTSIGVYAGNRGTNPDAHTVHVDYFTNTAGAPPAEDAERNTLTVGVVGGGLVQKSPDLANYACGDLVTLTALDQPGWAFTGWSGDLAGAENPTILSMDGPLDITATFVAVNQYTLATTVVGGGGSVVLDPPGGTYNEGTVVTVTATESPGWGFNAWSEDLAGSTNPESLTMDGNKAVTATFTAVNQFTLTADVAPGGSGSVTLDPPGGTYNDGTIVTAIAVPDPSWDFDFWSGDLTGSTNPETIVVDANKSITANFSTIPVYSLTTNVSGSGTIALNPDQTDYLEGSSVELTAVPTVGWLFDGWSGDLTGNTNPETLIMDATKSVTATFTLIPGPFLADDFNMCDLDPVWTFVDSLGGGGYEIVNAYTDSARVAISVGAGPPNHEIWDGVYAAHILQPSYDIDFTVEAKFDSDLPINYCSEGIFVKQDETTWVRAEFYKDDEGRYHYAVDRGPTQTTHDITMPIGVVPPIYMRLDRVGDSWTHSWTTDPDNWDSGNSSTFPYTMNVTGVGLYAGNLGTFLDPLAHTVEVDYINNTAGIPVGEDFTRAPLTINVVGGGQVLPSPDQTTYSCGVDVTLTAVESPGVAFIGWSGDLVSTDNPAVITMNGPANITATFAPVNFYTLDIALVGGGGSVALDPPGGVYNEGTVITVTAVEEPGWAFGNWSGDLGGSTNPETITMDGNKSVTATFGAATVFTLAADVGIGGGGSLILDPPGGSYNAGTNVTVTAVADTDWAFDSWSGDLSGSANPETILIDANKSITADFLLIPNAFVADDFNMCELDPIWTVVDPLGDGGTASIVGAYTDDARVAITVPGGPPKHEIWDGEINATHILQPALDVDFTVEAKFDSDLPADIGQEGILIKESETDWVRAEFYKDSGGSYWVAVDLGPAQAVHNVSLPPGTTPPLYMRVSRQSDTWTQSWSTDNISWYVAGAPFTYAMTVTDVGLYAGNLDAGFPGHTVEVDYFNNTAGAPDGEDTARAPLNVTVVGGGLVQRTPDQTSYGCDEPVTLTAVDQPGWAFTGWSGDLVSTDNPAVITMNGPADVTATFVAVTTFTLGTTVAGGGGSVVLDPPGGIYNTGTTVTVTAVDGPGWAFNSWSEDLTGTTNPETILMDGDKNVAATFDAVNQFTLTADVLPGGSGSVVLDPAGGTYNEGTSVTVTAVPGMGWTFIEWTGDLTGSTNPETVLMDGNKSVTATFLVVPEYTLTVNTTGMGSVVLDPDQPTYLEGTPVTLTVIPDPGWQFDGWSGDLTGSANPETLVMDGDKNVTAAFSDIPDAFLADDFNACELDPVWTFEDPLGDGGSAAIVNPYSDDARVAISVPNGSPHQIWTGIDAPHILQPTLDVDFTAEAKFDSDLPANWAQEGILIKQDDTTWLRLEIYRDGAGNMRMALVGGPDTPERLLEDISIPNTPAPHYLRVQRVADSWTLQWSPDGYTFNPNYSIGPETYEMVPTGAGPYAGNQLDSPAHTVQVDYFNNTAGAPVDEDLDRNDITISVVGNGTVERVPDLSSYACGEMVTLTPLAGTGSMFSGWTGDLVSSDNPLVVTMDGPLNLTATFATGSDNVVAANTSGVLGLSTVNTCETNVPVQIARSGVDNVRTFSATVGFTNLELCDGVASITEGDYLSSVSATSFLVTDNLDGTYQVDGTILGTPCGATNPSGVLFTLDLTNTVADGTGTITVSNLDLRDCDDLALSVIPGSPADIVIDTTAPANVTDLAAMQVLTDNPAGNVIEVDLAWTPTADATAVQTVLYRKGFGAYPEYDDNGGSTPVPPADPLAEGWELVATLLPADTSANDLTSVRDYWHYCMVASDLYGNQSASLMTGGVLNYLLGDTSDGGAPIGDGDNQVYTQDLTLLGSHYGTADGSPLYLNTLDIGPTDDMSVSGRPTTDNLIDFEDLILMGINYGMDATASSAPLSIAGAPLPASMNTLGLDVPILPAVGETFTIDVVMTGDGQIQGLQIPLEWDENMVEFVDSQGGPLLADQGGLSVVLSANDGILDVTLAGVRESGISGVGNIAGATFRVVGLGSPDFQIGEIDARDATNQVVMVGRTSVSGVGDDNVLPRVSTLNPNYPNPFNPMTTISFDLAKAGRVRISIFSIDGRLVKTLADESLAAGRHERVWAGRDNNGRTVASGTYLYTMEAPGIRETRRMLLVK